MTNELQRRTVLGGAVIGAVLLQSRAFAQPESIQNRGVLIGSG